MDGVSEERRFRRGEWLRKVAWEIKLPICVQCRNYDPSIKRFCETCREWINIIIENHEKTIIQDPKLSKSCNAVLRDLIIEDLDELAKFSSYQLIHEQRIAPRTVRALEKYLLEHEYCFSDWHQRRAQLKESWTLKMIENIWPVKDNGRGNADLSVQMR